MNRLKNTSLVESNMVTFNEKDGKGNKAWQEALAKAMSGKEFKETRESVLEMMADAKELRGSSNHYIQVGDHKVAINPDTKVKICPTSLGCTMVGGNDLFDLGFKCKEIDEHGVLFVLGEDSLYCQQI